MNLMPDGDVTDNPDAYHDYETEGRQEAGYMIGQCAVCGQSRTAHVHSYPERQR
jgi:hypothetical protein